MWNYSEKVKDHFFHPRNAKVIESADTIGDVGSLSCGDALRLMLKINKTTEVIEDAGFQTFGCGSAIASSSALTEMIIGKTLTQASQITNRDIVAYLDGLPPEKMHCSVMGHEALLAAIANYRGEVLDAAHEEGALICKCFAVDEGQIKRAVYNNQLTTLEEVINYTKAGGACASCHEKIERLLEQLAAQNPVSTTLSPTPSDGPVNAALIPAKSEIWLAVEEVIDGLRPHIQSDGGDIILHEVVDNEVRVVLSGACHSCMMAEMTVSWLQQKLIERLNRYWKVTLVDEMALAQVVGH